MNFPKFASICVLLVCGLSVTPAQELVSYSSNGQLYPAIAKNRYEKLFKDVSKPDIQPEEVALFKTIYKARMPDGKKVQLSGLVAIPKSGAPKGLVIYFHGTTADRENVPSRYRGNPTPEETDLAILAFTSAGYAVAAPDYLGLGDHQGVHPFPLASINCWSGIDLIKPARALAAKANLAIGKDLFVTGYSEGGAVAMWTVRKLEQMADPELKVTRAAPLSGPYDLSGTQAKSVISRQSNAKWLGARVYFSAYCLYGIQRYLPEIDINAYFSPSFATYIPFVFDQNLSDKKSIEKLVKKAFQMGAITDLNRILKLEFRNVIKNRDATDPIMMQLIANDCSDWAPKTPMYLFCVEDDFLVPKENTLVTIAAMRARGVGPEIVSHYALPGRKFDHMTGALPGLILARQFFDGGFAAVVTS
jgi:pimeloyl-ACP methyl ester carboxylesterase